MTIIIIMMSVKSSKGERDDTPKLIKQVLKSTVLSEECKEYSVPR